VAALGGADACSPAELSLVRRASVMTVELEAREIKFALGKATDDDLDLYQRTAGNLRRLLESVFGGDGRGLPRRPREVSEIDDEAYYRVYQEEIAR
jgi:hypothetical protein